ncbi:MAG TPA: hypothetical protein VM243_11975 [Phycisphaerae bacterium]|nr:hypothetical protein [Phycisphaerae bacterium]
MPVKAELKRGRWRIVEAATGQIATNRAGTAVDGGGHRTEVRAKAQAAEINASIARKK